MVPAGFRRVGRASIRLLCRPNRVSLGFWPQGCLKCRVRNGQRPSATNEMRSGRERRKWARLPLAIPVFIRHRDDKSNEILEFSTALNVSAGGMLVAVRKIPAVGSQVRLEIPSAPIAALTMLPKASRGLLARVLRSTPVEGYNLLGLKLSHPLLPASKQQTPNHGSSSRPNTKKRKAFSVA